MLGFFYKKPAHSNAQAAIRLNYLAQKINRLKKNQKYENLFFKEKKPV